jgi:hypothetical protein
MATIVTVDGRRVRCHNKSGKGGRRTYCSGVTKPAKRHKRRRRAKRDPRLPSVYKGHTRRRRHKR